MHLNIIDDHNEVTVQPGGAVHGWHGLLYRLGVSPCLLPAHRCGTCPVSAYVTIETEYRDGAALEAALRDVGWPVEVHPEGTSLRGYQGADGGRAHLVCRKGGHRDAMFEDVGFERRADGNYVGRLSSHTDPKRHDQIRQRYARHVLVAQAARTGYRVTETAQADGSIKLALARR